MDNLKTLTELFFLPWLVDDEVNGKPKKEPECCVCRAATQSFLGGKKEALAFTQSVSLYTEDFYPLFEWSFLHNCQDFSLLPCQNSNMIQIGSLT